MNLSSNLPRIIQGGMGIGISRWPLARAVSTAGQLGVVSGVALDSVVARTLQLGDPGGHLRRALAHFPDQSIAVRVLERYFRPGGIPADAPFILPPAPRLDPGWDHQELLVAANFAEVWLAREGHDGQVGINYLEKLQMFTLPSLYGAMLAGVDYVLMGAGIPREIPGVLDRLAAHVAVSLKVAVLGAKREDDTRTHFSPRELMAPGEPLKRPRFLAIVSSTALSRMLVKLGPDAVNGLVIEAATAGGHNAPPRGDAPCDAAGEPVYGPKDDVDLAAIRALGVPFWLAGSRGTPEGLRAALDAGAAGIQAGSAFALCQESSLDENLKARLLTQVSAGTMDIRTDANASPTGFPFKVVQLAGTQSEAEIYRRRPRICDAGGLRQPCITPEGKLEYRCPGEPVGAFLAKGGNESETVGRKCLCNALLANAGLAQRRGSGMRERPLVTLGNAAMELGRFLKAGENEYSARNVIDTLLG